MKSSSCTQPFTEYIYAQFQSIFYRTFLCVLSPSFIIVVLKKVTLKFKKWYMLYMYVFLKRIINDLLVLFQVNND